MLGNYRVGKQRLNSLPMLCGRDFFTAGVCKVRPIGTKSFVEVGAATRAVPIVPPAPLTFSTMISGRAPCSCHQQ
jgi:hypothetical protein